MSREEKAVAFEFKAKEDGSIEGYASRFGEVDQHSDIVVKGAFAETLSRKKPIMLWQHDATQPIGVWDEVYEDETGLYVKGRILDAVQKGREARALVQEGAINGMSIGYLPRERDYNEEGVRLLKAVELFEVSLVTFPSLDSARIDAIKASQLTERDMEGLLTRDAKLSRSVARALMSGGFDAIKSTQDAGGDGFCELAQFMRTQMKGTGL